MSILLGLWHVFVSLLKWLTKEVNITAEMIESKQRLVQTYIVLFGLLISYNHDYTLQAHMMRNFIMFLMFSVMYYTSLKTGRTRIVRLLFNLIAFLVCYYFSSAIFDCLNFLNASSAKESGVVYSISVPDWFGLFVSIDSFFGITSISGFIFATLHFVFLLLLVSTLWI